MSRRFLFDIGACQALALHSPFVHEQKLLERGLKTIRSIGGAGAGGKTAGQIGRVQSLQIGSFAVPEPITLFSEDQAGSFANAELAGNVGAQVAMRFRVYLDYGRKRIIFEPTARLHDPFDRAFSGLALRGNGPDFRMLSVADVLENSPASQAGLQEGDVLMTIDGQPAARMALSDIYDKFEKPVTYSLTIRRGERTITVALTPARLI
jgi:membrane-associated protease RseP (regulator of RpoE activity)